MKPIQIDILDDNMFFLKLFHGRLARHSMQLEVGTDFQIQINSYEHYMDFLENYRGTTDLMFLDFNLGSGFNAIGVIDELKKGKTIPRIAIITEQLGVSNIPAECFEYVDSYIRKDTYVIPKCCLLIQDLIEERQKSINENRS